MSPDLRRLAPIKQMILNVFNLCYKCSFVDRSATSALVCYERQSTFHYPDCNKPPAQSTVFCMRVRDDGGKLTPGEHTHFTKITNDSFEIFVFSPTA